MTTRTRPTMKSTMQNFDGMMTVYKYWDLERLERNLESFRRLLENCDSADIAGIEALTYRIGQLEKAIARRKQ